MPIFPFDPRGGGRPPIDPRYQGTATLPVVGLATFQLVGISNISVFPIQELRDTNLNIYDSGVEELIEERSSDLSLIVFVGG